MWTLEHLRRHCVAKTAVTEAYPFDQQTLVFKVKNKMFMLCDINQSPLAINLKCEPELSELLRQKYTAVKPGYHMNKRHWITVTLDDSLPHHEVQYLIDLSYSLVVKKLSQAEQKLLLHS
jgi:predicted DNA-binding protein (MmcQ/YjbR family)